MKVRGIMQKSAVNPCQYDAEDLLKKDGTLAVTMKFDLSEFDKLELGQFLLTLALGKPVFVDIDMEQPELDLEAAGATIVDSDESLPSNQQQMFSETGT